MTHQNLSNKQETAVSRQGLGEGKRGTKNGEMFPREQKGIPRKEEEVGYFRMTEATESSRDW